MKQTILVGGMTCNHCKMHVEKALKALPEVTDVKVTLANHTAEVETFKVITDETFTKVLSNIGYEFKGYPKP